MLEVFTSCCMCCSLTCLYVPTACIYTPLLYLSRQAQGRSLPLRTLQLQDEVRTHSPSNITHIRVFRPLSSQCFLCPPVSPLWSPPAHTTPLPTHTIQHRSLQRGQVRPASGEVHGPRQDTAHSHARQQATRLGRGSRPCRTDAGVRGG